METLLQKIINGQERTDRKLDGIQNTVAHIEEEIVVMKGNIKVLQEDMLEVKEDIQEVKGDIKVPREDMIVVKSDIKELKDTTLSNRRASREDY